MNNSKKHWEEDELDVLREAYFRWLGEAKTVMNLVDDVVPKIPDRSRNSIRCQYYRWRYTWLRDKRRKLGVI